MKIGSLIKNNNRLTSIWRELEWDTNSSKYMLMGLYNSDKMPTFGIFIEFIDEKYELMKIFYGDSVYYSFAGNWDLIENI